MKKRCKHMLMGIGVALLLLVIALIATYAWHAHSANDENIIRAPGHETHSKPDRIKT